MRRLMSRLTYLLVLLSLAFVSGTWCRAPSRAEAADPPAADFPSKEPATPADSVDGVDLILAEAGDLDLEAPLERLEPRAQRSESESDQIEALSLFAAARAHQQNEDLVEALRLYQRALRYDADALPILEQIVALAFELERPAEAVRYALRAAQLNPSQPQVLRQLGLHLIGEDDLVGAAELYEQAMELPQLAESSPGRIQLVAELAQLYVELERPADAAAAFAEVQEYLESSTTDAAEKKFREALIKRFGGHASWYRDFAEAYLAADDVARARDAFEKANLLEPNEALLAYDIARVLAAEERYDEALSKLERYFDKLATDAGRAALELLAELMRNTGAAEALIARLEELRQQQTAEGQLLLFLGDEYRAAERWDAALEAYRAAVAADETLIDAHRGLLLVEQARGDADALLTALGAGLQSHLATGASVDEGLDWCFDDIVALAGDGQRLDALIAAARQRPDEGEGQLTGAERAALALVLLEADRGELAAEFFDPAVAGADEQTLAWLRQWGLGLLTRGNYEAAAHYLERAIDVAGRDTERPPLDHYYLAGALEMADQTEKALRIARRASEMAEDFPRWLPLFRSRVAWVLYHAQRYDEAEQAYRELIEQFDDQTGSAETRDVLRSARLVLSNLAVLRGEIAVGEEWLEQVLDEFPEDISAQNDLGYLWADQGKRLDRALEMIQNAVAAEPDNEAYRDSLGWVLYRLGRIDEAIVELERAADTDEPDAIILDHLGDAYQAAGNIEAARDAWQQALDGFDPEYEAQYIEATTEKLREHQAPDSGSSDEP